MERNDNDKFDKTSDFLALMTRSERKAWERAQQEEKEKLAIETYLAKEKEDQKKISREEKNKENQTVESKEETSPTVSQEAKVNEQEIVSALEETSPIELTNTAAIQVGELSKTQHFLNLTADLAETLQDNMQENLFEPEEQPKKKKKSKNPIPWIGSFIILAFAFFIYLVIQSGYDKFELLTIDSIFLFVMIVFFGISILSNKTWMKVFSIMEVFVLLGYIGTNIFFLYDWNIKKEKEPATEPPLEEQSSKKEFECVLESEQLVFQIETEDQYMVKLLQKKTFEDDEEMNAFKSHFQEIDGLDIDEQDHVVSLTFDFSKIDINQYKVMVRAYLESERKTTDFSYIQDNEILYQPYIDNDLKELTCREITKKAS